MSFQIACIPLIVGHACAATLIVAFFCTLPWFLFSIINAGETRRIAALLFVLVGTFAWVNLPGSKQPLYRSSWTR